MNGRFFLDTNIFVYSFDQTAPAKARRAAQLIRYAVKTGKGIISYQIAQEFFNVALRRFAQPMTISEAEQYLSSVFRPLLAVHSSQALYGEALRLSERYQLVWFDALVVAAAVEAQCGILYSKDFQHSQRFENLQIENPFR
jgi:predicted nucleic acid-binding protein